MNNERAAGIKKGLANCCKGLRAELKTQEYPKAMCTGKQQEHRTATINCGSGYYSLEYSENMAKKIMESERLKSFLYGVNAKAELEQVRGGYAFYQIRINY